MKHEQDQATISELRREVGNHRPNLGTAEFELAYHFGLEQWDEKTGYEGLKTLVEGKVDAWRDKFSNGATELPSAEWRKVYDNAERAAREELLKSSAEILTLDKLQREAAEAQRKAKQKEAELTGLYNEWSALPEKALTVRNRLEQVKTERAALDYDQLVAVVKDSYRLLVETGNAGYRMPADNAASILFQREIRLSVLDQIEAESKSTLAALEQKNGSLSKQLGRPRHNLRGN